MAPGTLGRNRLNDTMMAIVRGAERERRPRDVGERRRSSATAARTSCRSPSAPRAGRGSGRTSTWMPTPVRKPISTEADRKSPRNPSRSSRAMNSMPPQMIATRLQNETHSGDSGVSPGTLRLSSPAERMAAVAESAPTTSSLDAPSRAKNDGRKDDGVEPGDDRRLRDRGVAHRLRDGDRSEGDAGDHVRREPGPVVRAHRDRDELRRYCPRRGSSSMHAVLRP